MLSNSGITGLSIANKVVKVRTEYQGCYTISSHI